MFDLLWLAGGVEARSLHSFVLFDGPIQLCTYIALAGSLKT